MKPPSKIKVGPYTYTVEYDKEAMIASGASGACMEDVQKILLDPDVGPDRMAEVLLHEVLHGVWGQTWMDYDIPDGESGSTGEKVVATLAYHVLSVLRDNPKLVQYLTERN